MSLDDLDRVARERIIGSPPHSLQHLGTMERLRYINRIGTIQHMGTLAVLGTVLMSIHVGTIHRLHYIGTLKHQQYLGTNRGLGTALTPSGTLSAIERVKYIRRAGSIGHIEKLGSLSKVGTIDRLEYISKMGTISRVGTVARLGSVHYLERIGTLSNLGTLMARYFSDNGAGFGLGTHVARGSRYTGSWMDISRFRNKTLVIYPSSLSGTIHIMTSILGNAIEHGTYYTGRIEKGTYTTKSFTEAFKEARAEFEASGSSVTGKGTLKAYWGLQV